MNETTTPELPELLEQIAAKVETFGGILPDDDAAGWLDAAVDAVEETARRLAAGEPTEAHRAAAEAQDAACELAYRREIRCRHAIMEVPEETRLALEEAGARFYSRIW